MKKLNLTVLAIFAFFLILFYYFYQESQQIKVLEENQKIFKNQDFENNNNFKTNSLAKKLEKVEAQTIELQKLYDESKIHNNKLQTKINELEEKNAFLQNNVNEITKNYENVLEYNKTLEEKVKSTSIPNKKFVLSQPKFLFTLNIKDLTDDQREDIKNHIVSWKEERAKIRVNPELNKEDRLKKLLENENIFNELIISVLTENQKKELESILEKLSQD